jgi:hypothetical protein
MLPQNRRSGLPFPYVSPDMSPVCHSTCLLCVTQHISCMHVSSVSPDMSPSHITQPPVSWPPRHYLVTPVTFLVLVCAQNIRGHCGPCLQSSFTCVVKKFCSPRSFTDLESCHPQPNLGAAKFRQQDTSLLGRAGTPPSQTECKILDWAPKLLELITLSAENRHTRDRKSWQGNFLLIKRLQAYMLTPTKQTCKDKMAHSGSYLYAWPSCTCPSPGIYPGQRFTISPNWLKGLGDGLEHAVWWAMELFKNPEEEARTL